MLGGAILATQNSILGVKQDENNAPAGPTAGEDFHGLPLSQVVLLLPSRSPDPIVVDTTQFEGVVVEGSMTGPEGSRYLFTLSEGALNVLVQRVLAQYQMGDRYRNVWVDLESGGLVVNAEVGLGIGWQQVGLVMRLDGLKLAPERVKVAGISIGVSPDGPLGSVVARFVAAAQDVIDSLTVVGPLPGVASISQVSIGEDSMQIMAEATPAPAAPSDTGWQALPSGVELREIDVPAGAVTERLVLVKILPGGNRVAVRYAPDTPGRVSEWAGWELTAASAPLIVVNGGYYDENNTTLGLLISDGVSYGAPLADFAGMLAVDVSGAVSVRWLREWPYDAGEGLLQGLQSYPMLVKPGGEMGFPAGADDGRPARRTFVGQTVSGNLILGVAPRGYLSLHALASALAGLGVADVAVNLDGGGSTGMWVAQAGEGGQPLVYDSTVPVPSVIVVQRP